MARVRVESTLKGHEILRVGHYVHVPHPQTTHAAHPHAVVGLVQRGRATLWCGASYRLVPGDLFLLPDGVPHATQDADGFELLGLALCTSCLGEPGGTRLRELFDRVREGECPVRRLAPAESERVTWLLTELGREDQSRRADWRQAVDALLTLIHLVLLRASLPPEAPSPATAWIGRALGYISLNATAGISLADVAAHVDRAPTYVATAVRAQTGQSVVAWIAASRLASARRWLVHSDRSIEEIAAEVGYPSVSQFYRVFRRAHGTTPSAWRRVHAASAAGTEGGS